MKTLTVFLVLFLLSGVFATNSSAQEKSEQLWLVGTEVIKPEMMNQYMEINKELLTICKKCK